MRRSWIAWSLVACASGPRAAGPAGTRADIEAFNERMRQATLRMDDDALISMWEPDGVSLLPGMAAIVGREQIGAFIKKATNEIPGARMKSFEMTCAGIEIAGDLATEYCHEHQVVDLGADRPPFDGAGNLLYVLHRGPDGVWRLRREMWNPGL